MLHRQAAQRCHATISTAFPMANTVCKLLYHGLSRFSVELEIQLSAVIVFAGVVAKLALASSVLASRQIRATGFAGIATGLRCAGVVIYMKRHNGCFLGGW